MQYPFVLGHEPAGIIDATGKGVTIDPGTRVAIEPAMPCRKCEYCRAGRQNICPNTLFLGTPPTDGIFCQYRLMPEANCLPIPSALSMVEAAMLEPLAVGLHAVGISGLSAGNTAAIFGAGPIGLVTLLAARAAGAAKVLMVEPVAERREMALDLGADAAIDAAREDPTLCIQSLSSGRGVDIAFEAAGDQQSISQCCAVARPGGKVILIGSPRTLDLAIPMHECRRKELLMQHVRRSNGETHQAIELALNSKMSLRRLATHFFSLEEVSKAFDMAHRYSDGIIRGIILPHGEEGKTA